jgi:hypothetical protein
MRVTITLWLCLLPTLLPGQSTFSNKVYGISLVFPSNYKLHRGELGQDYSLGYLGQLPMEFAAPGGVRVVTVEVPGTLYPNTDFNAAFVTVSVNQYLTREECDRPAGDSQELLTLKIDGIEFHGAQEGDAGLGHQFGGTYYHAFLEGTCYELGEGIATSGYGAVDGMKKLDGEQVSASLDGILQSVKIEALPEGVKIEASPSIHSFSLSPLRQDSPTSSYRLSWQVNGAEANQVWLSAECSGDLRIVEMTRPDCDGHVVLCDALRPTQATSGSLDLEFNNLSGGEIQEKVRIFAKGRGAVSKEVTIDLPPLPVLITVARYPVYSPEEAIAKLFAGHELQITGVAFLPRQTLWIGSTRLPVESVDNTNITFSVPESLPEGQYALSITNERGRSNVVTVQVVK